jgi:hypothetical protein
MQRASRAERCRQALNKRLAATSDPRDRFIAAADYYRTALARNPDAVEAERLVELLMRKGDELYANARKEES